MKKNQGFTLLEILIALSIFSVLAVITSSALFQAFNTRSRLNVQTDRLNAIQLTINLLQRDIQNIINRPVRGNDTRLFASFIGTNNSVEFTRAGLINPGNLEKRSELKRLAFICEQGNLIRRSWITLDTPDRSAFQDKILLTAIKHCEFNYLNQTSQTLNEWRENAVTQDQKAEPLPKAVQLDITLEDWGNMKLLFIILEAAYAKV